MSRPWSPCGADATQPAWWTRPAPSTDQGGYVTPAFVAASGLTLVLLVILADLLLLHYAQGVLHAAAEQAAREGAATGSVAACEARASFVVDSGLGRLGDGVDPPVCAIGPDGVTVELEANLQGWTPLVPATRRRASASVHTTVERP